MPHGSDRRMRHGAVMAFMMFTLCGSGCFLSAVEARSAVLPSHIAQSNHGAELDSSTPSAPPSMLGEPGWTLTWSDEFEGSTLNTSVWNVRTNESHCCGPLGLTGELELYLPDEVFVAAGALNLRTRKRTAVGPQGRLWNYTSGWVDTEGKWSQKYGRFEANCSLPSRDATGIWPAFWLMPESKQCWPTGGEIDIFEFNGNWLFDLIYGSYHWGPSCGNDKAPIPGQGVKPAGAVSDWQMGWHVYAVEWYEDRMDFYLDGVKYFSRNSTEVIMPTAPMHIIFDQAVDQLIFPPWTGPAVYGDGVFLRVDYVRVFEQSA